MCYKVNYKNVSLDQLVDRNNVATYLYKFQILYFNKSQISFSHHACQWIMHVSGLLHIKMMYEVCCCNVNIFFALSLLQAMQLHMCAQICMAYTIVLSSVVQYLQKFLFVYIVFNRPAVFNQFVVFRQIQCMVLNYSECFYTVTI